MAPAAGSTSSTDRGGKASVLLGRVVGAHGLHGELRVRAEGDLEGLLGVPQVWVAREGDAHGERREVVRARAGRPGEARIALGGVDDRDAAEALRGAELRARARDLPALPDGEFYAFELVGCSVVEPGGRTLGRVREIWETGASDLLVIEGDDGRDHLVPALEAFLAEVDLAARRIVVDAPPGLLGAEAGEEDACSGST